MLSVFQGVVGVILFVVFLMGFSFGWLAFWLSGRIHEYRRERSQRT